MLSDNPLLTVAEVAEHIGCSDKHVRALIKRGDLKASHLLVLLSQKVAGDN